MAASPAIRIFPRLSRFSFIAEEQRHSAMLARYLRLAGAPLLGEHWIHSVFRRIRHWAGLESKVTVLVTAEILAVPYYRALMETTRCPALTAICQRVLREEAQHLLFQGNTLRRLQQRRPGWWVAATHLLAPLSGEVLTSFLAAGLEEDRPQWVRRLREWARSATRS